MADEPQPLEPGQRLIVDKSDGPRRAAPVLEIGDQADAVTVGDARVVGGSYYPRDVVWVRYDDDDAVEAVQYDHVTAVD